MEYILSYYRIPTGSSYRIIKHNDYGPATLEKRLLDIETVSYGWYLNGKKTQKSKIFLQSLKDDVPLSDTFWHTNAIDKINYANKNVELYLYDSQRGTRPMAIVYGP